MKSPASPQFSNGTDSLEQYPGMLPHLKEGTPDASENESESLFSFD